MILLWLLLVLFIACGSIILLAYLGKANPQKECKIPEYAFKCSNCHCDELNRGR